MQVRLILLLSLLSATILIADELMFEQAVDRALQFSRQIKISQIDAQLAQKNTLQNAALMSPKVSISWLNSHYDSAITMPFNGTTVVIRPQEQSLGSLVVQQPLSPLIGLIQKMRADHKTQKAAEAGYELTQSEIAFACAQTYRQIQQLKALARIATERVTLSEKQEQDASAIYRAGRISKDDLLRIQMGLGQARVAAKSVQTQFEAALYHFKDLLGYDLTDSIDFPSVELSKLPNPDSKTLAGERLDIKAARLTFEAAKENSWLTAASFLPVLGAFARIDKNFINPGSFGASNVYSLGFNLSWDIWDGGARFINISSASLISSKARLNFLTTSRNAQIDQEQKRLELDSAIASLSLQKTTLEQAKEAYKAAFERFKNGALSTTDLLAAELGLNNANVEWAKAVTDLDIKNMAFQKAGGAKRPTSIL